MQLWNIYIYPIDNRHGDPVIEPCGPRCLYATGALSVDWRGYPVHRYCQWADPGHPDEV